MPDKKVTSDIVKEVKVSTSSKLDEIVTFKQTRDPLNVDIHTFGMLKNSIYLKSIRKRTIELLEANPKIGEKAVLKHLKVTKKTLANALDVREDKEDEAGLPLAKIIGGILGTDFLFSKGFDVERDSLIEMGIDWLRDKLVDFPQITVFIAAIGVLIKKMGTTEIIDLLVKLGPISRPVSMVILIGGLFVLVPFLFGKLEPALIFVMDWLYKAIDEIIPDLPDLGGKDVDAGLIGGGINPISGPGADKIKEGRAQGKKGKKIDQAVVQIATKIIEGLNPLERR